MSSARRGRSRWGSDRTGTIQSTGHSCDERWIVRPRTLFLVGVLAVPVIFLLGAATSRPAWKMNSPLGQAMPVVVFVAGVCCLVAPFRTDSTGGRRIMLVLGAGVTFVAVIAASVFTCMLIWGGGIG